MGPFPRWTTYRPSLRSSLPYALVLLGVAGPAAAQERVARERLRQMSMEELLAVQVQAASKVPERIGDIPATVRVITAAQIRDRGYVTLEEALADLPGMQFRNTLSLNSYVFQRGVPNQNNLILVLVDGIQINELNSGGFYGGGQYNLSNVERIEVVYGPAAALYGTNAMSGIVNIVTKGAEGNEGLDASALAGSFKTAAVDVGYGYHNPEARFGIRVSGMVKTSEKGDLAGAAGDGNWSDALENFEDDYSADGTVTWGDLTGGFVLLNRRSSAGTYNRTEGTDLRDHGTLWNIRFFNSYLKHHLHTEGDWSVHSQVYYRNATVLDNSVQVINDTAQVGYFRPNHLLGVESTAQYSPHQGFSLVAGAVAEREELANGYGNSWSDSPDRRPPPPPSPEMISNTLVSGYVQARRSLADSLDLIAGARFDHSSAYGSVLTPRLGLVYNRDASTLKVLYLEAFRAPRPWDYTWGSGNPDLDPEDLRSFEVALARSLTDRFRLEASLYRNELTEVLTWDATGSRWVNSGTVTTRGAEITANYVTPRFNGYANLTFTDSRGEADTVVPEISSFTANLGGLITATDWLSLHVGGNYIGGRRNPRVIPTTGDDRVGAALVLNTALTISKVPGLDLQVVGKNILDEAYYHTSNRSVTRWRQPQRTFLVRLIWHGGER